MALTGLAAGSIAVLASARPVQAPAFQYAPTLMVSHYEGGCSDVPAPAPSHGIVDAEGRRWELSDMPGRPLRGFDLRNVE
jgi:Pentapeptide repeats (8 copies)